ncbi:MAG TPA: substrate-binding domain-containing protein, partial [Microbacterium sp.]|nr:substrate-binding domain-containing protein [Microbacterium sp.]
QVDAVWSANDANAAGVISILMKNNLRDVPISGQDAQLGALQYILTGWQTGTVWKPVKIEAEAAVETAVALLNGETPKADQQLEDGTPYIAVTPNSVGPDQVKDVVAGGDADAAELCTGDVDGASLADACAEHGVQ